MKHVIRLSYCKTVQLEREMSLIELQLERERDEFNSPNHRKR